MAITHGDARTNANRRSAQARARWRSRRGQRRSGNSARMTDRRTTLRPVRPGRGDPPPYWANGDSPVALGGGLRRLVRRHERVAGQGRDPAAPSGLAASPAVRQPARLGGDRRGRRSAAPVYRRHHARRDLRLRGLRPGDRRPYWGPAGAGGLLGRGGAPGLRTRMAAGPYGGISAPGIPPRPAWATVRSTPCYAWTRSSSPSSQTPSTASYRGSLGPADVRC
jgi:hypothetical protein